MIEEILNKVARYLEGELSERELRNFAGGIVDSGDKRLDDLAEAVFIRFVLAEEGVISPAERDAELRGLLAGARAVSAA